MGAFGKRILTELQFSYLKIVTYDLNDMCTCTQNDNTKRFLVKPINETNPNLAKSKWFEQGGFVFLSVL
jgi:hypothetical protein